MPQPRASSRFARRALLACALVAIAGVIALPIVIASDAPAPTTPAHAAPRPSKSAPVVPSIAVTPAATAPLPAPSDPRHQFASALAAADRGEPVPPPEVVALIERGLAATGATSEPWTRDAERTFASLTAELATRPEAIAVSNARCFAAGCIVSLAFPPNADVPSIMQGLGTTRAVASWSGSKLLSPPVIDAQGAATSRLVLVRPDAL